MYQVQAKTFEQSLRGGLGSCFSRVSPDQHRNCKGKAHATGTPKNLRTANVVVRNTTKRLTSISSGDCSDTESGKTSLSDVTGSADDRSNVVNGNGKFGHR